MMTFISRDFVKFVLIMALLMMPAMGFMLGLNALSSLLVKRAGIQYLPYVYILTSLFNIAGSIIFLLFADRATRSKMIIFLFFISGLLLLGVRYLIPNEFSETPELTLTLALFFIIAYFVLGFFMSALNTQIWTLINDIYRPNKAKKLFPFFSSAWLVGGGIGGVLVHLLVPILGVTNLILAWGCFQLGSIPLVWTIQRYFGSEMRWKPQAKKASKISDLKEVYSFITSSSISYFIVAIIICFCILGAIQDFQYNQVMNITFNDETSLSKFFGTYAIVWNSTAILLQLFIAEKLLFHAGIFRSFLILPIAGLIGFSLLLIHFAFWEGLALRYSWNVFSSMAYFNAYQLTFNVIPIRLRGRVRNFCGGIVNALGTLLGGVILASFQLNYFKHVSWQHSVISIVGIVGCVIWLIIVWRGHRVYIQTLIDNLNQDHVARLETLESMEERREPIINETLNDLLIDPTKEANVETKTKVMDVLSKLGNKDSLRVLSLFIHDSDSKIRAHAVAAISSYKRLDEYLFAFNYINTEIQKLFLKDSSATVRKEAGKFLLRFYPKKELPQFIKTLLDHPESSIRIMTMQTIMQLNIELIDMMLVSKLEDSDPAVVSAALLILWKYNDYRMQNRTTLLRLLTDKETISKKNALITLILLGSPSEYLQEVEKLLVVQEHLLRSFACVYCISLYSKNSEKSWQILSILLDTLADSQFDEKSRQDFIKVMPHFNDDVIDALLDGLIGMDAEKRAVASKGIENLADLLYSSPH